MYCLRCGKETPEEHVFCESCLQAMEQYPVKPGIPVQLPNRPVAAPSKKTGKKIRNLPVEEQLEHLRKILHRTNKILLFNLFLLLAATAIILYQWQTGGFIADIFPWW